MKNKPSFSQEQQRKIKQLIFGIVFMNNAVLILAFLIFERIGEMKNLNLLFTSIVIGIIAVLIPTLMLLPPAKSFR